MAWNKNSEEAFPARHPREPGGLRQDILDEIADHLACSAEREHERDQEGDEETVWRRVLDKFGDPDTVARRLWWDQMRETVMREWIQTGVLALLAVASITGIVLVIMMMGRLSQTNDAMQTAMEQVAATNEALVKVLSGLPGGDTGADSLDLATIEVVVRRGSPEGPPAPEVEVLLAGKGSNDQELKVDGQADMEGRTVFERLAQGRYGLNFYDPVSKLRLKEELTLFAGQGAGEYIFVAPDVTPRPVHIDWDLPEYGRDDELLINCGLKASWSHDNHTWYGTEWALVGRAGTWVESFTMAEEQPGRPRTTRARPGTGTKVDLDLADEWEPVKMAGEIRVSSVAAMETLSDGRWTMGDGERREIMLNLISEDDAGAKYSGILPEEIQEVYAQAARLDRSQDHVQEDGYAYWLDYVTRRQPESIVVAAESVTTPRWGSWKDGVLTLYAEDVEKSEINSLFGISQDVLIVSTPSISIAGHSLNLAIRNSGPSVFNAEIVIGTSTAVRRTVIPVTGNALVAYALRGARTEGAAPPVIDADPFWQLAVEDVEPRRSSGNTLLIPIPAEAFENSNGPITGVLLRWKENPEAYQWGLLVESSGEAIAERPCWVVTAPATSAAQPLNVIDGRFHYDALQGNEVR